MSLTFAGWQPAARSPPIADSGIGIADAFELHVFDSFGRSSNAHPIATRFGSRRLNVALSRRTSWRAHHGAKHGPPCRIAGIDVHKKHASSCLPAIDRDGVGGIAHHRRADPPTGPGNGEPTPAHRDAVQRLAEVPGLGADSAQQIIAEVGPAAATFPSPKHLASWFPRTQSRDTNRS
jgi:transposase IS116/IS110/IS902 family protein